MEYGRFGLPKDEVMDLLSGRRTHVSLDVGYYRRDMYGDCSPQDLETQLQMMHMLFTAKVRHTSVN